MNGSYPELAAPLIALMAARGVERVHVPILQPADPFLDMAGEELRRRIFMTQSETGESLCLRPEFTIPVCRLHIASGKSTPRRYGYLGEVFRQRREGGNEFYQTGIEDIGDPDPAAADARSVADALAVLDALLPGSRFVVTCGDKAVFEAVLAGLDLPPGWRKRLGRTFGSPPRIAQALADLTRPNGALVVEPAIARHVDREDEEGLAALIGQRMQAAGLPLKASRTPREIARRLIEKAALASARLSEKAHSALRAFLAIRTPLQQASAALTAFSREHRIELGDALEAFRQRAAALDRERERPAELWFDASFGRPLEYYSGFVYEIRVPSSDLVLAGGGRYDRLLTLLGARQHIPAVGFSAWLDRIELAAGAPA